MLFRSPAKEYYERAFRKILPSDNAHSILIEELINHYKPKHIVAIGGEILVQDKAFNMLFDLHEKFPEMEIETITNLCVGEERLKQAEKIFNSNQRRQSKNCSNCL